MGRAPSIRYEAYRGEEDIEDVMRLIEKELRHATLMQAWCDQEDGTSKAVGVIVCKLDRHLRGSRLWRGYIAMLSVDPQYRGLGIATTLVRQAIGRMVHGGAEEIVLETEVTNHAALRLYEHCGFLREKRLYRFYMNGNDAFRLVLVCLQRPTPNTPPPRRTDLLSSSRIL